eukprot:TRINITY_DN24163_c0_g1_i1.p1 TRINITY_DN24163_c0_g1~~TRINITY_DN24163_c0_g1_i1.p1  ORF type:complete len:245 (+),score=27.71 TRINITY_DN24163_c0_g1_i1:137-871(+)
MVSAPWLKSPWSAADIVPAPECAWAAASEVVGIPDEQARNLKVVQGIYEGLKSGDLQSLRASLCDDIDWWFHGPRSKADVRHIQLMPSLVGTVGGVGTPFEAGDFVSYGDKVFVEGLISKRKGPGSASWVHVWTLSGGKVTGLREYVNTAVYAAMIRPPPIPSTAALLSNGEVSSVPVASSKGGPAVVPLASVKGGGTGTVAGKAPAKGRANATVTPTAVHNLVWESKLWRERDLSTPGLILTI